MPAVLEEVFFFGGGLLMLKVQHFLALSWTMTGIQVEQYKAIV